MDTRVLIVDDSELTQRCLSELVQAEKGFDIVGTAANGLAGLELAQAKRPDLVTLDLSMPVMDGFTTLKHLMTLRPVATVVVSSFATDESHLTFDCLRYGAVDFVTKPSALDSVLPDEQRREIVGRLRVAAGVMPSRLRYQRLHRRAFAVPLVGRRPARHLAVIAAGRTGLVSVLHLLGALPCHPELALVVLLDAPVRVVESFAQYAAHFSAVELTSTIQTPEIEGGTAYLSPSGTPNLVLSDGGKFRIRTFAPPPGCSPEAMTTGFLLSTAEAFRHHLTVTLLSGAGTAMLGGLEEVLGHGGVLFVQDPETALEPEVLSATAAIPSSRLLRSWGELAARLAASLCSSSR